MLHRANGRVSDRKRKEFKDKLGAADEAYTTVSFCRNCELDHVRERVLNRCAGKIPQVCSVRFQMYVVQESGRLFVRSADRFEIPLQNYSSQRTSLLTTIWLRLLEADDFYGAMRAYCGLVIYAGKEEELPVLTKSRSGLRCFYRSVTHVSRKGKDVEAQDGYRLAFS